MKLEVKKNDIKDALAHSCFIIDKNSAATSPILSNVKLEVRGQSAIRLTSTDMSLSLQSDVLAAVDNSSNTDFAITLPARTLHDIIRKVGDDEAIKLQYNNGSSAAKIILTSGEFSLPVMSADDYPNFKTEDNYQDFTINSANLSFVIDKVKRAISNEEIRYYLNGIYLHTAEVDGVKKLIAVATDGHRLAKAETIVDDNTPDIAGAIVHRKAVHELLKILEETVGEINLGFGENKLMFKNSQHVIVSKIIDGKFPDYQKAIPQNNEKHFDVVTADLLRAIDLVISVSSDKIRSVKLSLNNGKLVIAAASELDANTKGMQEIAANYNGEAISFGFNARYIVDALNTVDSERARFSFSDHMTAVLVEDPENPHYVSVLMPMQI